MECWHEKLQHSFLSKKSDNHNNLSAKLNLADIISLKIYLNKTPGQS
jgi:hypothetical protein